MDYKKYNIVISQRVTDMLINHVRFLAQVSETAAQNLRNQIIKEIQALQHMPETYPRFRCEGIPANKYRKKLVEKRYLLIYQIKEDTVYVDYVLDCRQDYQWLL